MLVSWGSCWLRFFDLNISKNSSLLLFLKEPLFLNSKKKKSVWQIFFRLQEIDEVRHRSFKVICFSCCKRPCNSQTRATHFAFRSRCSFPRQFKTNFCLILSSIGCPRIRGNSEAAGTTFRVLVSSYSKLATKNYKTKNCSCSSLFLSGLELHRPEPGTRASAWCPVLDNVSIFSSIYIKMQSQFLRNKSYKLVQTLILNYDNKPFSLR